MHRGKLVPCVEVPAKLEAVLAELRAERLANCGPDQPGAVRCKLLRASTAEMSVSTPPRASAAPGK